VTIDKLADPAGSSVTTKIITIIVIVFLEADHIALMLEKLCALLRRTLECFTKALQTLEEAGIAWWRFRAGLRRALAAWRQPPNDQDAQVTKQQPRRKRRRKR
jgi:hypothetical protein